MTLTNHIRRIEELTNKVLICANAREYEKAHCAIDDIVSKAREVHQYIERLQWITPRVPGPAGGDYIMKQPNICKYLYSRYSGAQGRFLKSMLYAKVGRILSQRMKSQSEMISEDPGP